MVDVAAGILHEAERRYAIGIVPKGTNATDLIDCGTFDVDAFLDETHLILDGATLQYCFEIVDPERHEVLFSWREWGHHMAAWANRIYPVAERVGSAGSICGCPQCASSVQGEWDYLDFYDHHNLERHFEGDEAWRLAFLEVVRRKVELFGVPCALPTTTA